jgi:hypothetical protein
VRRRVVIGLLICVFWFLIVPSLMWGVGRAGGSSRPVPPSSPGAVRVIVNGEWVYFQELYSATAVVNLSGCYSIAKNPSGPGHVITMTWSEACQHTFLDANVTRYEARR